MSLVSSGAQVPLPQMAGPPTGSMPMRLPQVRNSFARVARGIQRSVIKAESDPSSAVSLISPANRIQVSMAQLAGLAQAASTRGCPRLPPAWQILSTASGVLSTVLRVTPALLSTYCRLHPPVKQGQDGAFASYSTSWHGSRLTGTLCCGAILEHAGAHMTAECIAAQDSRLVLLCPGIPVNTRHSWTTFTCLWVKGTPNAQVKFLNAHGSTETFSFPGGPNPFSHSYG